MLHKKGFHPIVQEDPAYILWGPMEQLNDI